MKVLISIYIFILGSILGSFFACVIVRGERNESIWKKSSHCDSCGKPIKWYENIPIVSYIALKGRCSNCKAKITPFNFVMEIIGGLSLLGVYVFNDFCFNEIVAMQIPLTLVMLVLSGQDYKSQYIFSLYILLIFIFGLGLNTIEYLDLEEGLRQGFIVNKVLGLVFGYGVFKLVEIVGKYGFKKELIGHGDTLLFGVAGSIVGIDKFMFILLISSVLGCIVELIFRHTKKEQHFAFCPYICFALYCVMLFGDKLLQIVY